MKEEPTDDDTCATALLPEILTMVAAARLRSLRCGEIAKQKSLIREAIDAGATFGDDSPEAVSAMSRIRARAALPAWLLAEAQRRGVRAPQRAAGRGVVHGRVTDTIGVGLPGLSVRALDESGYVLEESDTDEAGHFTLQIHPGQSLGRSAEKGPRIRTSTPIAESGGESETTGVRLEVRTQSGRRLHLDPGASVLRAGQVAYREIPLGDGVSAEPKDAIP